MPTSSPPGELTRREAIVSAGTRLFARHGYRTTGVDEIGEAAGITGPGVYRYFDSKAALLNEVVQRPVERVLADAASVVEQGGTGWEVLDGLVRNMIGAVADDRSGWTVTVRERRHLDPEHLARMDALQAEHLGMWLQALAGVRPDLTAAQARVLVQGTIALSAMFVPRHIEGFDRPRAEAVLRETAMAVLRSVPGT